MAELFLAVDIGGTKLAAGVVDRSGSVIASTRRPTPRDAPGEAVYDVLIEAVREALGSRRVEAAGVGCGGPMDLAAGVVSPLHIPGWRDFPLVQRLSADLGVPVFLDNDAKAFALGQYLFGTGRGHPWMLGVIVSTGVGGGVIEGGELLQGRTGNAGHIGHVVVEPEGPECACGGRGCVEAIASGTSIARLAAEAISEGAPSLLIELGSSPTARDVAEAARRGDTLSADLFERAGRALGVALSGATALLDVDLVVLGGGVTRAGDLLLAPIRRAVAVHARLSYLRPLQVLAVEGADEAALLGAAALAIGR